MQIQISFDIFIFWTYNERYTSANNEIYKMRTTNSYETYLSSIHAAQKLKCNNKNHLGVKAMPG